MRYSFYWLLLPPTASARDKPHFDETDRVRLAEAFRLGDASGNQIWTGWNRAPFAVLLVRWDYEFRSAILNLRQTSNCWATMCRSEAKSTSGKQTYSSTCSRRFRIAGIPTIVIGQAQNTSRETSTPWVVTVLHEHSPVAVHAAGLLRRRQCARPVALAIRAACGCLNYPFPYDWHEMQGTLAPL